MPAFSVLMSIYHKENPSFLQQCFDSICTTQSHPADEIVLIKDGALTAELDTIIAQWQTKLGDTLKIIALEQNVGLGKALNIGLQHCQHEWVFRMDTDDIASDTRFEKQLNFIENHPEIAVLGGQIIEFDHDIHDSQTVKAVPETHAQILQYAKSRNPINHMTVAFKKSAVEKVGGYRHAPLHEDYDLWVRLLLANQTFANLPDVLVYARTGQAMYQRRGGRAYVQHEITMQKNFHQLGFLTTGQMLKNLAIRLPVRLLPNSVRAWIYQVLLRK